MSDLKNFIIKNGVLIKYKGIEKEIVIPKGVQQIGRSAFFGCRGLTSITIPESMKKNIWWPSKGVKV